MLANILKMSLPHIINYAQSTFIQERDIAKNISLAQEICGELNYGAHKRVFCAKSTLIKILTQLIEWPFLIECFSWDSLILLWIGSRLVSLTFPSRLSAMAPSLGFFYSTNDLHQGYPLSLFLFSIIMDIFSYLVDKEVNESNFIPLYSRRCAMSHLLFAGDVHVFGKANSSTLRALHRCLFILDLACGLTINNIKSVICFTRATSNIFSLYDIVNIQPGSFPI